MIKSTNNEVPHYACLYRHPLFPPLGPNILLTTSFSNREHIEEGLRLNNGQTVIQTTQGARWYLFWDQNLWTLSFIHSVSCVTVFVAAFLTSMLFKLYVKSLINNTENLPKRPSFIPY